ncbi:NuA3 histone acetyltransferase complex subunit [Komagataella phaffii CBS 7435]|uniref:NuA3 histone acetyltransferase complex subunit n=1 Tax=Komagataella phaffii (strain ATCC 76273 / CBS 7435 / CECT 11047 / NRRL Y-11430 / Wegner 21-1) TaxID=981350 RepID=F2QXT3_KOMPC|nr:GQ67_05319T0 [Komagataella phaffii]AOA70230.1 GQ68_05294T0 [Komagataella phaffii GS115]CAH2450410.1 NuA3 histone acetyltransferase complex subunit [Komagataella phaffii CBS 7435]CCA40211.1 NuA3 histone acetyltransferase complex subunit [Komagataella phaffii CBS 7435]
MVYNIDKPREETDYREFYPDLDEKAPLRIILAKRFKQNQRQSTRSGFFLDASTKRFPSFRNTRYKSRLHDSKVRNADFRTLGYLRKQKRHAELYGRGNMKTNSLVKGVSNCDNCFEVLYDIDEQDYCYLKLLNERRKGARLSKVSLEILEVAMTYLEFQWFFLEKLLPPNQASETLRDSKYGSDDGIGIYAEDQPCAVCNESDCDVNNVIIFCDGCNIAVHQECYGITFIPEGPWFCRRCIIAKGAPKRCQFCPSVTGAFKQTDTGSWSHIICGLWINELYFANPIYMEPIEGTQLIPRSRWKLKCFICKLKIGACIQCSNKNCFTAYHVTCAKRAGLFLDLSKGLQACLNNPRYLVSYCDKHSPIPSNGKLDLDQGICRTRRYCQRGFSRQVSLLGPEEGDVFSWRTSSGTHIAPEMFANKLGHFFDDFNIHVDSPKATIYELCGYWALKRQAKYGLSLIKRLDPIHYYGQMSSKEISERIESLSILKRDVQQLSKLAMRIVLRSELQLGTVDFRVGTMELLNFPATYIIRNHVLNNLNSSEKYLLSQNQQFNDLLNHLDSYHFKTVSEFTTKFTIFVRRFNRWRKLAPSVYLEASKLEHHLLGDKDFLRSNYMDTNETTDIRFVPWIGKEVLAEENLSDAL